MTTVLLVEDNEMNRDMLSRRLGKHGFVVETATNGAEGIEIAESLGPDIILLDMSMPVMDGWEAARLLKANEEMRSTPIIALTAHAMTEDRDKALAAGCDDYDTKPIKLDGLIEKINALVAV